MAAWMLTLLRLPIAAGFAVAVGVYAPAGAAMGGRQTALLLALVVAAEGTDLLDGWAARRLGAATELGGLADPLCDSLARLTMYFAGALAGWVWIGVPLAMAGRDIVVAYVRVVLGLTGGRTSARASGKAKAVVQGAALLALVALAGGPRGIDVPAARRLVAAAVLLVTCWSLLDYLRAGWPAARRMARRG